ncbi:type IV conjugative transfer system protein TraL [Vibrio sp. S11_S32]|uniref:type IV conjugative transfer system protein TraL n=1 Tax=Vibrio sp. S11_S32 TaxID=2720225 RepID=UPI0016809EE6|nr:type IV conjugative transfer system protein TraL [Vibrio sp. S11_S32]MBD1576946.1 type IV conjugative transfer system protein TraL [Vibrio sp. S11_S32]
MTQSNQYFIPRLLDTPPSIAGVPLTEIAPALVVFLGFLLVGHEMIGFICALPLWAGMKRINTRYGQNALQESMLNFLPYSIGKNMFKFSPPNSFRYWRR